MRRDNCSIEHGQTSKNQFHTAFERMVASISIPFLALLLGGQSLILGFVVTAPIPKHRNDGRRMKLQMSSSEETATTDEYDEWYADFNPEIYGDYSDGSNSDADYDMTPRGGNRRGGGRGGSFGRRGSGGRSGHDYTRDTDADNSQVDLHVVDSLISDRLHARKTGRFEEADAIRDQLLKDHGVMIRDKERMWRSGCSDSGSGRKWMAGNQRGGRNNQRRPRRQTDFGPNGHDYNPSPDAGPNGSALPDEEIHRLLAERLECKLNRDFYGADQIQEELFSAGVWVHDGRKEWRADGRGFGNSDSSGSMKPSRDRGSRSDRANRAYEESPESLGTEDEEKVMSLMNERMEAKQQRNYDVADAIRDELMNDFNVYINDRLRQWSVGGEFMEPQRNNNRGRVFGPYKRAAASETPEDPEAIQRLVDLRDQARKDRDYVTADSILEELKGQDIEIDDKSREWALGGYFSNQGGILAPNMDGSYARRGGGSITEEEEELITQLLKERSACKRDRQFGQADRIRDRLRDEFQVRVDDKNQEWHIVTSEYVMTAGSHPLDDATQAYVEDQVKKRAIAKLNRDYTTADAIRDELMDDYLVSIDDRVKEWTALAGVSTAVDIDDEVDEEDETVDEEIEDSAVAFVETEEPIDESRAEDSSEELSSNNEDLDSLTVVELKDRLRDAGLPVSGRKAELIERLQSA